MSNYLEQYRRARAAGTPAKDIILCACRIANPTAVPDPHSLYMVRLKEGIIQSISNTSGSLEDASYARSLSGTVIDCQGKYLVPGLCDAHLHCTAFTADLPGMLAVPESLTAVRAERVLEGMLLRGFTTVRDCGGADWGLAQAVEEGTIAGPRLLFTGHALSQTGGHGDMRGK